MTVKQYKKIKNDGELKKSKAVLTKWFNLYCRLRDFQIDLNGNIFYYCCACGRKIDVTLFSDRSIYNGKDHHASHFRNSDQYGSVEYNEDNVNCSDKQCNRALHGNKDAYQINLIKKIGKQRFEKLIRDSNKTNKLNILDIDRMIYEYKDKCHIRAKELSIKI